MFTLSSEQIRKLYEQICDPQVQAKIKEDRKGYVKFPIEKKNGTKRWIHAPHFLVKNVQEAILREIPTPSVTHFGYEVINGFCPGRNIVDNAKPHLKKKVVLSIDLKNFFPSFTPNEVYKFILKMCNGPKSMADAFQEILTTPGKCLPQGAPTSPMIANWLAVEGDKAVSKFCQEHRLDFTRYADDLTFSTVGQYIDEDVVQELVRLINTCYGQRIKVAPKKVKFMRSNKQQRVTGIVTNDKLSIPRARRRRLRAIMHHAKAEGLKAALAVDGLSVFQLYGEISYLSLTHRGLAEQYIKTIKTLQQEK